MRRISKMIVVTGLVLGLGAGPATAGLEPEAKCQTGRVRAWSKYQSCWKKLDAQYLAGAVLGDLVLAYAACNDKLSRNWPKLQALAGTSCDMPRYSDNGSTVTDNLTRLVWEKKTDDFSIHDWDEQFTNAVAGSVDDGTVYTSFLEELNTAPGCFTGHCDWRLPTISELATIAAPEQPCETSPCIAATFGLTKTSPYTTRSEDIAPVFAWQLQFGTGLVDVEDKEGFHYARAVRRGLD